MTNNLNGNHQRSKPYHWPHKMSDVSNPVGLYAHRIVIKESGYGESQWNHGVHRGRIKSGNKADEVQTKDKKEDCAEKSHDFGPSCPTASSAWAWMNS